MQGSSTGSPGRTTRVGAAAGRAVLATLRAEGLIERSAELGGRVRADLRAALDDVPAVGDVRGLGLMIGIELVRDPETKEPFARDERVTERIVAAARQDGLLVYSSTGHVDGNGDLLVLGPPFCLTDGEATTLVERTAAAIRSVL